MKIAVLMKQVPNEDAAIKIESEGKSIIEDNISFITNEPDTYGLEEALLMKDKMDNIDEVVRAAILGLSYNFKLILCGLYGQNPSVIESLVEVAKKYKDVVGIDIAGGPRPTDKWGLHHYVDAYQEAKLLF